jgi:hypothetical protein
MSDERSDLVELWNRYHPNEKIEAVAAPRPVTPGKPIVKPAPKPRPKPAPKVLTSFGVDISGFNNPNLAVLKEHGISFVASQVTDGRGFADWNFAGNYQASRRDGIAFQAYHFMRSTSTVRDQLANIADHIVDKRIPVSLDCEPAQTSRPTLVHVRQFIDLAPRYGIRLSMLYFPHWYWMQLGAPSLRGLPLPLWQSSYGPNRHGSPAGVYAGVGGNHAGAGWTPQGGVTPLVFQYGSNVQIPGYGGTLDADAYRGPATDLIRKRLYI